MAGRYSDDNNRDRWHDEDRERSNWRSGQERGGRDEDRGFFERAGEEIRSWFSDDDDRGGNREQSSWNRDQNRNYGGGYISQDRQRSYGSDRSTFGGMAQGGQGRSGGSGRDSIIGGYEPSRGGEWRSDRSSYSGSRGQGSNRDHAQSWGEANRGQSGQRNRDRDQDDGSYGYSSGMSGSLGGFGNQTSFGSSQDDHYRSWRDQQLAQLDRDYDDYCRERGQQFHDDFNSWRSSRSNQSPSGTNRAAGGADTGVSSNAGVGTTTASMTGSAGAGSALGSATGTGGSIQADTTGSTETAGAGESRSSSKSRT